MSASVESTTTSEQKSSWFSPLALTNQLSSITASIFQATSKVGAAATTLVQKSFQQESTTTAPNADRTGIFNDLGSTVLKSAQQWKQAVEESSFLGHFSREQDKFLIEKRTQQQREEASILPWMGHADEDALQAEILTLSKDKRNFLRAPPPGADYQFDMTSIYPVALAILHFDEQLNQMRFDLVPKQIAEETFWRNYFYRVHLVKQSTQLNALVNEFAKSPPVKAEQHSRLASERFDSEEKVSDVNVEFVSEDYDTSAISMDEIRREIEQLNSAKPNAGSSDLDESEWDKALADELENVSAEELEAQINQMLTGQAK